MQVCRHDQCDNFSNDVSGVGHKTEYFEFKSIPKCFVATSILITIALRFFISGFFTRASLQE